MKPYRPKKTDYEKLRDKWYKKIATVPDKNGNTFKDIERPGKDQLKVYMNDPLQAARFRGWEAKAQYYSLAERFLNEYRFESRLEAAVWEYHANGISRRNIAKILKKARVTKLKQSAIGYIIDRLKMTMFTMYMTNHGEYHE